MDRKQCTHMDHKPNLFSETWQPFQKDVSPGHLGYAGMINGPKSQGLTSSMLSLDVHCSIPGTSVGHGYSGTQAERTAVNSNGTKC